MAIHSMNTVFLSFIISNSITAATQSSMEMFIKYAIIGIAGFAIFMLVGICMVYFKTKVVEERNMAVKSTMIEDLVYHSDNINDHSKDLSFMTNDLKQLETKGFEAEYTIINFILTFFFAISGAFSYDSLTTVAFIVGTLMAVLISLTFQNSIRETSRKWSLSNARYTNRLKDYFKGIETVRTYQVEGLVTDKAIDDAQNMESSLRSMSFTVERTNQIIYISVMVFGLLMPFGVGIFRVIQHGLALASFIAIVQLSNSLRSPALQITQLINGYATTRNIREKYLNTLEKEVDHVSKTSTSFESLNLKDITVKFDNEVLFENLDLEIKKGDKILMVGPSGIGKSTLLRVIQKSLPTSEGTYVYNGAVQDEAVDGRFSLIRQHPLIFDDSLVYNITLGVNYSDEAIAEAIKDAQLEDVVNEKGLNYRVGESGKNLSIGELQRIEIARALITKRDIILADEITSALDTKFADNIREMLLASPYTVVEVAHKIDESEKSKYTHIWDVETFRK